MRSRLEQVRLTPGFVVSLVAMFFAIGGIGYAASKIDTKNIENGAVTKKKIAKGAVDSKRIKNRSIKCIDLKDPACLRGPAGARGPQGPQGPQGPEGPQGPAGPANVQVDSQAKIAVAEATPSLANGGIVPLAVNEGFAWAAVCKAGASGTPGTGSILVVQNISGGNDSHINGALTFQDAAGAPIGPDQSDDFDQGEVAIVANAFTDNTMSRSGLTTATPASGAAFANTNRGAAVLIYGNNGETQMGQGGALRAPAGYPDSPACVASLNLLAK